MANPRIMLINSGTTAAASVRSSIQLPSTMAPVQPINGFGVLRIVATGAFTATVLIEGSLNDSSYSTVATWTLAGTNILYFPYATVAPYPWIRGNVSAISGTATTIDLVFEYTAINQ